MQFVLTLVQEKESSKKITFLKKKVTHFLHANQIPLNRIEILNPQKAFDIYFDYSTEGKKDLILGFLNTQKNLDYCWQRNYCRKKKIFFSDMDGTIIKNETFNDLGEILGIGPKISRITKLGIKGKINFLDSLQARVKLLTNRSATNSLSQLEKKIELHLGALKLIKVLKKNGVKTILITGGFSPTSNFIKKKLNFDHLVTNHYVIKKGKFTGKLKGEIILPTTKKEKMLDFLNQYNYKKNVALAIGDGMNDLEMLSSAGLGIAFKGVKGLKEKVPTQINFSDLTSVLYFQGYALSK